MKLHILTDIVRNTWIIRNPAKPSQCVEIPRGSIINLKELFPCQA